jgi:RNA polymerase sigma-70 factor (ECF subfamily)
MARFLEPALVNGSVGLIFAPRGRLLRALSFRIDGGKIVEAEIIAKPERLQHVKLSVIK